MQQLEFVVIAVVSTSVLDMKALKRLVRGFLSFIKKI